ncbi:tRNA guanosine(34) transglycosylase Tgt [Nanchangia anserum]|uniref:tRNA guanosine(34) transglycosylase Tgt n=1 Tax=Nanchangia anserum TaxID=2692125 RepID=UPI001D0F4E44|nr:tRNA guanosine(34) transglycosylase Tgt [Nanchangia anserum]
MSIFRRQHHLKAGFGLGRTGEITTPHGVIATPAFIPVGTKATLKSLLPESLAQAGAQAVLANAYHLFLQPGHDIVDEAGGLGAFMNWPGPTFTDSGGFQVMSLGSGFKKVLSEEFAGTGRPDPAEAAQRSRPSDAHANVDDDGVDFRSHITGDVHRFTPEVSMEVQHGIGADIIFAFDELTTLLDPREYQEEALERTRRWAWRSLVAHKHLNAERRHRSEQLLFGVIQGAGYEDLRRKACRDLRAMHVDSPDPRGTGGFDGYGIGGALEKENLGRIVAWCCEELPEDAPRHLLGISEPDDFFAAIEAGADTFDCVSPSRVARNGAFYTPTGRNRITKPVFKRQFSPMVEGCACYTCTHYTAAYVHHLFKAHEMLAATLTTIHNEHFIIAMVDGIRRSITEGTYEDYKAETLGRFYGS